MAEGNPLLALKRGEAATDPITGRRIPPFSERHDDEDQGWYLDHFTTGELSEAMVRGVDWLKARILFWQLASAALLLSSGAGLAGEVQLDSEPGIMAVLYVVSLGLGVAALLFHSIRRRAVRQLHEVDHAAIEDHIRINALLNGSQSVAAAQSA